ncbi:MAG: hypothetical protein NT014_06700 [Candidatus Omnitrophica bacterium]|nr:hypothetical protein [Candidatus Omnitrophota bacterium]
MKRKKHLLRLVNARKKNKEKNKNKKESKDNNLSVYSYKCGHKNVKLTVQKVELLKEPEALNSIFYYNCTFCSKDFDSSVDKQNLSSVVGETQPSSNIKQEQVLDLKIEPGSASFLAQTCPDCGHPLVKINLKKCLHCGAKNNPLKQSCWVCSTPFPIIEVPTEREARLVLTLNIDGNFYRNTDKTLGLGMKRLFEDLILSGFSKEPLEAWMKIHESDIDYNKETLRQECKTLAQESTRKSIIYAGIFILMIIIGLLIIRVFWSS